MNAEEKDSSDSSSSAESELSRRDIPEDGIESDHSEVINLVTDYSAKIKAKHISSVQITNPSIIQEEMKVQQETVTVSKNSSAER